jgi:hypothetical protein
VKTKTRIETTHRLHHAFARPLGPHVDVEVVGVAHERVTALLQLFVHVVQQHVRQERRQRPALWRALVTLHHHPVRENPRVEVAANEPQHATVLDPLREPPHEHVVVHTIEELLQIDVHDPAATLLHVALRVTHGVVRAAPRPEAVAVLREARIDSRLQDLQPDLLDEAVEHRRDAELALASAGLGDHHSSHRARLVAAREEVLTDREPVLTQEVGKLLDRHPVDAGAALVLPNSFQRGLQVPALARQLHQTARSWARVSIRRRRRFRARVELRGFTPPVERELQLPGLLRRCVCETRGRTPSSPFGPSPPSRAATTTSADFSLRASRRVALSGVRRDLPR